MPVSSSSLMTVIDGSDPVLGELAEVPAAPAGLWECVQQVADPRKRRGVRHLIAGIVALALAATLAGAQSFVAIGEWARLDPARLDALIGAWMWLRTRTSGGRRVIAFDGKSLRGPVMRPGI
jgi:hypothetical protein